ncbi:hypothetical protein PVK06_030373 [Gossypium arboreum]|uniref:Uncharacterized protein n=1 Tax=Gossypium arboreum TaxID=29729 RepID=A0ABR0NN39_GOSAR|nr:hypothetical protein PVK06_030373 [Gossypium arboreum]
MAKVALSLGGRVRGSGRWSQKGHPRSSTVTENDGPQSQGTSTSSGMTLYRCSTTQDEMEPIDFFYTFCNIPPQYWLSLTSGFMGESSGRDLVKNVANPVIPPTEGESFSPQPRSTLLPMTTFQASDSLTHHLFLPPIILDPTIEFINAMNPSATTSAPLLAIFGNPYQALRSSLISTLYYTPYSRKVQTFFSWQKHIGAS